MSHHLSGAHTVLSKGKPGVVAVGAANVSESLPGIDPADWLACLARLDGKARMLVGSSRSLLCCDGQARQALANEADLRIRRGRVEPVDPAQLNRFEALLEVELGATESLWLPRKRGSGHLLLRATRLVEDPANPIIAICFREAGEELAPQWADFTEVFDLTAAEGRIVRFLLSGRSAEQIASENHLSVHTIRSHVSHVYAKIGVSCREELWRRLASYRLD